MIFAELFLDFYYLIADYKFWKKKRAQRKYEKENGLPKKLMIYPSDKMGLKVFFIFFLLIIPAYLFFFKKIGQSKTKKQIATIKSLLEEEKKSSNLYPKELKSIIRNNPLLKNITNDSWNNEFYYKIIDDGFSYKLISKGKDGLLNTKDDIE